ncbi:hypothetical protein GW846_00425 [Candidatus Gracilibacteria bacterium]|nr:hypothetical protein [Candidatus Gracilibacteria bacterium]
MKKLLGMFLVLALAGLASCSNDYEEGQADDAAVDATVEVGSDIGDALDATGEAIVDGTADAVDFVDGDDDDDVIEDEMDGVDDNDADTEDEASVDVDANATAQ